MTCFRFPSLVIGLLALAGCSTPSSPSAGHAPSAETATTPPANQGTGAVNVSLSTARGRASTSVSAYFAPAGGATEPDPCTTTTVGTCSVLACPVSPTNARRLPARRPATNATTAPLASAGGIDVRTAAGTLNTFPGATGEYGFASFRVPGALLVGNVQVEAFGDVVPTFSANVPAPSSIAVRAPKPAAAPDGTSTVVVDRAADLAFTWDPAPAADVGVRVFVASLGADQAYASVSCDFVGSSSGTIPVLALQELPATDEGTIDVASFRTQAVAAGDFAVKVSVDRRAGWPDESFLGFASIR
jgi:hypothetical protein